MDEPLTRTEKRRLGVNLALRFGTFGYVTWWFVDHVGRMAWWGVGIYVFLDLVLLLQPLLMVVVWIYFRLRGE